MYYSFEYDAFNSQSLSVSFKCPKCDNELESEEISIPQPDLTADTHSDSQTDEFDSIYCENCDETYEISLHSTLGGGTAYIQGIDDGTEVEVKETSYPWDDSEYYDSQYDAIFSNTEFFGNFLKELSDIKLLLEIEIPDSLKQAHYRHLYSSVIGNMETYLSDAYINTVLSKDELLEKFFGTFHDFDKISIKAKNLYKEAKDIQKFARKYMIDVIYHNIVKVGGMYKDTLGVVFPEFGHIMKAVEIRHHTVHRNGKDKEGNAIEISKEMLDTLILDIKNWIEAIDTILKEKHHNIDYSSLQIDLSELDLPSQQA